MVCWWIDQLIKSRVSWSICRQIRSAKVVPTLGWRQLCANPRQSYNVYNQPTNSPPPAPTPYPHLQPSFLMRSCIKTSKIVKNVRLPKVQKYSTLPRAQNTMCGLFFSFRWKVHLCCRPCSLLVSSCADPFRIISHFFQVLFYSCFYRTSNFFPSRVLKLITAIYIYYIC